MDKTEVRLVAIELLAWIKENIDDSAIIAGGFARDMLLGEDVKDLDIWIKTPIKKAQLKPISKHVDRLFSINRLNDFRLIQLTKFRYKNVDVDVIVVDPKYIPEGKNATHTFDFGICQAWTEDGVVFKGTDLFNNDVENGCITYHQTDYNDARIDRIVNNHLPRLVAKYPIFRVEGLPTVTECNDDNNVNGEFTIDLLIKMANKLQDIPLGNKPKILHEARRGAEVRRWPAQEAAVVGAKARKWADY